MEIHSITMLKFPTPTFRNCIHELTELHVSVLKHTILNTECKPSYILNESNSSLGQYQHNTTSLPPLPWATPAAKLSSLVASWGRKERVPWWCSCRMKQWNAWAASGCGKMSGSFTRNSDIHWDHSFEHDSFPSPKSYHDITIIKIMMKLQG